MAHKSNWELINGRNFNWQVYPPPLIRTVIKDVTIFMQTFRIIALRDLCILPILEKTKRNLMYQNMTLLPSINEW